MSEGKEKREDPRLLMGKLLLHQIEDENQQCAFWIISTISKFESADPGMSITCLLNILRAEMPKAAELHAKYLRET
jgi:hypothetical protein